MNHGFSLLEMLISVALLSLVMVMGMTTLMGVRSWSEFETARNDLTLSSQRANTYVQGDFSGSVRTVQVAASATRQAMPPMPLVGSNDPADTGGDRFSTSSDASVRVFARWSLAPATVINDPGSGLAAPSGFASLPDGLPADHYADTEDRNANGMLDAGEDANGNGNLDIYSIGSNELVFQKLQQVRCVFEQTIEASGDIADPDPFFTRFSEGRNLDRVRVPTTDNRLFAPGETLVDAQLGGLRLAGEPDLAETSPFSFCLMPSSPGSTEPRLYAYLVLPDPGTGLGRLVRAVRIAANVADPRPTICTDSASGWRLVEDHLLARQVTKMRVETFGTVTNPARALGYDQSRMTVWMARRASDTQAGTGFVTHRLEVLVTHRNN